MDATDLALPAKEGRFVLDTTDASTVGISGISQSRTAMEWKNGVETSSLWESCSESDSDEVWSPKAGDVGSRDIRQEVPLLSSPSKIRVEGR